MNIKRSIFLACLIASSGIAQAKDFTPAAKGIIDFDTPSMNMCCSYVPNKESGPLLSCSREKPKYWTVVLESMGKMTVYKNPGDVATVNPSAMFWGMARRGVQKGFPARQQSLV
jgi:hypothetical protein